MIHIITILLQLVAFFYTDSNRHNLLHIYNKISKIYYTFSLLRFVSKFVTCHNKWISDLWQILIHVLTVWTNLLQKIIPIQTFVKGCNNICYVLKIIFRVLQLMTWITHETLSLNVICTHSNTLWVWMQIYCRIRQAYNQIRTSENSIVDKISVWKVFVYFLLCVKNVHKHFITKEMTHFQLKSRNSSLKMVK